MTAALTATVAAAAPAWLITGAISTPQLSGAPATLSVHTMTATISGAAVVLALPATDRIELHRPGRRLNSWRLGALTALLTLGSAVNGFHTGAAEPGVVGTYLFFAGLVLLAARWGGLTTAGSVFAAYVGACLFAGVSGDGRPRWWAAPVFAPADSVWFGLAVASSFAATACVVTAGVFDRARLGRARGARSALDHDIAEG